MSTTRWWTALPLAALPTGDHTAWHRSVMSLFGPLPDPPRASAGVLFRVEPAHRRVLVQSVVPPEPASPLTAAATFKEVALPSPTQGQRVAYRAALAAVRRRGRTEERVPAGEVAGWAAALLERRAGLVPLGAAGGHVAAVDERRSGSAQPLLRAVTLCGSAEVADPGLLGAALADGVGRARAYGCGLLTVLVLTGP